MKKRYSEEQIIAAIKEHEAGAKVDDICRRLGISSGTFYNWRSKYAGLEVSEALNCFIAFIAGCVCSTSGLKLEILIIKVIVVMGERSHHCRLHPTPSVRCSPKMRSISRRKTACGFGDSNKREIENERSTRTISTKPRLTHPRCAVRPQFLAAVFFVGVVGSRLRYYYRQRPHRRRFG